MSKKDAKLGWIGYFVVVVLLFIPFRPALALKTSQLKIHYLNHYAEWQKLQEKKKKLRLKIKEIANYLSRLKREAQRGFLGIPARLRLPFVRRKAQRLGEQMERLDTKIRSLQQKLLPLNRQLQKIYRQRFFELTKRLQKRLPGHQRRRLLAERRLVRAFFNQLRRQMPAKRRRKLHHWQIELDKLDGPREIRQKFDALKDMEDSVRARLKLLQGKIKKLQQLQKDLKLAHVTETMLEDDDMFGDDSPRIIRKPHSKAAPAPKKGGISHDQVKNYGQGTPVKNSSPTLSARSQRTSELGGRLASSPKPSSLAPNPMNPKGTIKQKLQALRAYQKQLKRRLTQLKKRQQLFQRRLQQLKNEEKQKNSR